MNADDQNGQTELVRSSFVQVIGPNVKTFGQSGRAKGLSDGIAGVQWNAWFDPERSEARMGVNLEGKKYDGWPIARFIERELECPGLTTEVAPGLPDADKIIVDLWRDAWQRSARPPIVERNTGDMPILISVISMKPWIASLEEAYQCLDAKRAHRGRSEQEVTLSVSGNKVSKEVSPHLNISTVIWSGAIASERDARDAMLSGRERDSHPFMST